MKNKLIVIFLIILVIALSGVIVYLVMSRETKLVPDYASGTIDTNAVKEDKVTKKKYNSGSGGVNLKFSNIVEIKDGNAKLYFKNPGTSSEDIILILLIRQNDEEIILGKSDVIPAGYAVYNMKITNNSIPVGGYDGILKTVYYNSDTKAKEMIDSEIKVKIEVK